MLLSIVCVECMCAPVYMEYVFLHVSIAHVKCVHGTCCVCVCVWCVCTACVWARVWCMCMVCVRSVVCQDSQQGEYCRRLQFAILPALGLYNESFFLTPRYSSGEGDCCSSQPPSLASSGTWHVVGPRKQTCWMNGDLNEWNWKTLIEQTPFNNLDDIISFL